MTPLPPVDDEHVRTFWEWCVADGVVPAGTPLTEDVGPFGDHAELADELIDLVVHGPKRATAGAVAFYEHEGFPLPAAGDLWIVTDGRGQARALLRYTDVRIGPLSSVDDAFAWDEGEGDRTRATWLADHTEYFERSLPPIGVAFTSDLATVFCRFEVLTVASDRPNPSP